MRRYIVYLYTTATGIEVVANKLGSLAKSSPKTFSAIQTGIEILETYGADPGLNRFERLRHIEGGIALWAIRVQAKPAYRVLFAPVPGEDAFVLLHVVAKSEMARASSKFIGQALEFYEHWLDTHNAQKRE